jgi:cutinase
MKSSLLIAAFISAIVATPVPNHLEARQSDESDELENGACKAVTFIFARGSTEAGNMVNQPYPTIHRSL